MNPNRKNDPSGTPARPSAPKKPAAAPDRRGSAASARKAVPQSPQKLSARNRPDGEEMIYKALAGTTQAAENVLRLAQAVRDEIQADVAAVKERDPAATSTASILLLYSGLHAVLLHRAAHALHTRGHVFSARLISQLCRHWTGVEIHPGATIGRGLFIDHGSGVVIGETAELGDNCTIYQGATLGGTGKDTGKRHPTLGNNVMVGAGSKVLGPIKIGDNVKIAANAVVLKEIPPNSTAVGIPAKVVRRNNQRVNDLDQIHIPDPVANELARLAARIGELERELAAAGGKAAGQPDDPQDAADAVREFPEDVPDSAEADDAPGTDGPTEAEAAEDGDGRTAADETPGEEIPAAAEAAEDGGAMTVDDGRTAENETPGEDAADGK